MNFYKSNKRKLFFFSLCLVIIINGCSGNSYFIVVPDNYYELAAEYPLLNSHSLATVTNTSYNEHNTDQRQSQNDAKHYIFLELCEVKPFEQVPDNFFAIGQKLLVPAVPLHSLADSVCLEDVRAYFLQNQELPGGIEILPLETLSLPLRAVSVQGNYINDPGYPLVKTLYARFIVKTDDSGIASSSQKSLLKVITGILDNIQLWLYKLSAQTWLYSAHKKSIELQKSGTDLRWVVAVGDVMLGRGIDQRLMEKGVEAVFTDTLPHLRQGSITACNFEAALSQGKGPIKKSYNFFVPHWTLPYLKDAGFNYLTLTNNHVWDFGIEGFIETLQLIQKSSFATSGVGMNVDEAQRPWVVNYGTTEFSVLSVAAYPKEKNGFNGLETASAGIDKPGILFSGRGAEQAMKRYFGKNTFNIVFVHGGVEGADVPEKEYEILYRSYVDLGADLVIGSHPHILQRMEAYKGALVAYSLGDFIFAEMDDVPGGEDGLILKVGTAQGRIVYVEPIPVKLSYIDVKVKHDISELEKFMSLK